MTTSNPLRAWAFLACAACFGLTLSAPAARAQDTPAELVRQVRAPGRHLRQGSRGPAVVALQRALTRLGHSLSADGDFGPLTAGQVRAFQRSKGLSADGIVGPLTIRALEAALGASGSSGSSGSSGPAAPPAGGSSTRPPSIIGALGGSGSALPPSGGHASSGGRALFGRAASLSGARREAFFWDQLRAGATPRFMDDFQKVTIRGQDARGVSHVLEVWVSPDYLSVGTDADFVRVPLMPATAQRVCDRLGCLLPTRKLVDAIYSQASVKLSPQPLPPGPAMTTTPYFLRHDERVRQQLQGRAPGALVAGHKKDVVISPRLQSRRGRVAIYGWHRTNGRAIQPLSTVHGSSYVDYSHGVRLVRDAVRLDGRPASASAILRDSVLHPLLSDEGRFSSTRAD